MPPIEIGLFGRFAPRVGLRRRAGRRRPTKGLRPYRLYGRGASRLYSQRCRRPIFEAAQSVNQFRGENEPSRNQLSWARCAGRRPAPTPPVGEGWPQAYGGRLYRHAGSYVVKI